MTDPEVQAIYEAFMAAEELRRFTAVCDGIDRSRQAHAQLGYSEHPAVFTTVGTGVVPEATVKAVGAVVSMHVSLLAIPRPTIRYFRHENVHEQAYRLERGHLEDLGQFVGPLNLAGRADRGDQPVIWILADLPLGRAMQVAAHECRHLAQSDPHGVDAYVANEEDARAHEAAFTRAYLDNVN